MYIYDRGTLFLFPHSPAQPPIRFGSLQNVELTFDFELKAVRTQLQAPVKFTRGLMGVHGKAQAAQIDGALFGQFLFSQVTSSGSRNMKLDKSVTLSGSAPTFTPTNYYADLGVMMGGTGMNFVQQPVLQSALTTGQYTVNGANLYLFSVADTGSQVFVSYISNDTTGKTVTLTNPWMQEAKPFGMLLSTTFNCKQANLWLPACVSKQLILPTKLEQFSISDFSFEVQQDSSGEVGRFSFAE